MNHTTLTKIILTPSILQLQQRFLHFWNPQDQVYLLPLVICDENRRFLGDFSFRFSLRKLWDIFSFRFSSRTIFHKEKFRFVFVGPKNFRAHAWPALRARFEHVQTHYMCKISL